MKKTFTITVLTLFLTGCMNTRYITERYIKTNIEKHSEGDFSTIKTYSIFKGVSYGGGAYLELTGYKYNNKKELVIGADRYYMARKKFPGDQTTIAEITYIDLTLAQCKAILDNYQVLQSKVKAAKPKINEEIYHDYTVSDDLFISYKRTSGRSSRGYIDFWIKGEKYSLATNAIIAKLEKFMSY